jgi:hypothetical protein
MVMKLTMGLAVASVVLAASASYLVVTENEALGSVHVIHQGQPVNVWLAPGAYNVSQDPGTGSWPNPELVSVAGQSGPVKITGVRAGFEQGALGGFLGTPHFAPVGAFRINRPGDYRIELQAVMPDLYEVVITEPYASVAIRAVESGFVSLVALVVLLMSLVRLRGQRRTS